MNIDDKNILSPVLKIALIISIIFWLTIIMAVLSHFNILEIKFLDNALERVDIVKDRPYRPARNSYYYSRDAYNMKYDQNADLEYMNNIINIVFNENIKDFKISEVVDSVDGKIIGFSELKNLYQIEIEEKNLDEILDICEKLKQNPEVFDAVFDDLSDVDVKPLFKDFEKDV